MSNLWPKMHVTAAYFLVYLSISYFSIILGEELPVEDETLTLELLARLEELELYIKEQDHKIKEMEKTLSGQRRNFVQLQSKLKACGPQNKQKQIQYGAEENKLSRDIRAAAPQHVAFSVYLDHLATHIGIDQVIPFNKAVLNDGRAYNTLTGIFTCPVSGVYLFSYMVNTYFSAYQLVVKLVVDGVNYSDGTSDPFHNLQESQGGNTVIIQVNKTQSVWLAAYNTGNTVVDGRKTHRFSTLSGVLLYET